MNDFPDCVRHHWFAIARSARIRRIPQRLLLFGSPVVLVRDEADAVLVFEDRCPHRGAPLSAGRLTSEGLACPYHGWTFAAGGHCTAMPGALGGKPVVDARVPSFAVQERDGLVWVSHSPANPLPGRILALEPGQRRFLWQTRWGAPILEAQENFLDALHTHLIHPGLVRGAKARRPVSVTLHRAGDGFHVDYIGQPKQSGLLFRLFESRRTRERAYFSGLGVAQIEYQYQSGWTVWITLCFTPETVDSTAVFATLHVAGRWAPAWVVRTVVWPFLRQVARQDQRMLELQRATRDDFPTRRPVVTPLDIVRPHLEAAWADRNSSLPAVQEQTLYL